MVSDKESRVKGRLALSNTKLNTLLEITNAINNNSSSEELYHILKDVLTHQLLIDKFVLYVFEDKWTIALTEKVKKTDLDKFPIEEVVEEYHEISTLSSVENSAVKEFDIVVPVYHKNKPLAYLLLADFEEEKIEISPIIKHLKFIQTLANIIVVALENKRLNKEYIKQIAVKKELELAQNMQSLLFPSKLPKNEFLEIQAYYEPHSEVGGDYYDVVELSDGRIAFVIADVSGKGMPAALLMANFQANLRALLNVTQDLETLIKQSNQKVIDSAQYEKFITLFIAIYDTKSKELEYLNAGHHPAILKCGEEFQLLKKGCTVLGMFDELPAVEAGKLKIKKDSIMLCFTDGLSELENEKGKQLDLEGVQELMESKKDLNQIHTAILNKVEKLKVESGINDDITFLALSFLG